MFLREPPPPSLFEQLGFLYHRGPTAVPPGGRTEWAEPEKVRGSWGVGLRGSRALFGGTQLKSSRGERQTFGMREETQDPKRGLGEQGSTRSHSDVLEWDKEQMLDSLKMVCIPRCSVPSFILTAASRCSPSYSGSRWTCAGPGMVRCFVHRWMKGAPPDRIEKTRLSRRCRSLLFVSFSAILPIALLATISLTANSGLPVCGLVHKAAGRVLRPTSWGNVLAPQSPSTSPSSTGTAGLNGWSLLVGLSHQTTSWLCWKPFSGFPSGLISVQTPNTWPAQTVIKFSANAIVCKKLVCDLKLDIELSCLCGLIGYYWIIMQENWVAISPNPRVKICSI